MSTTCQKHSWSPAPRRGVSQGPVLRQYCARREGTEGSGSGRGNVSLYYRGARLGRSARDKKKGKRRKKEGDARSGGGTGGCSAPPFTAREVSRDRGNFLLSRAKTAARNGRCRFKRARGSASFRKRDHAPHRNKKIGAFPHARWIVSSISDAPVRHGRFLANGFSLIPVYN